MKVLLLEDDHLIAELIEMVLMGSAQRIELQHVTHVAQAKEAWLASPAQLILCDQRLPDGSGLELVKLVRSSNQQVPIVMFSTHADREIVLAASRYGISDFMAKPFNVSILQQRLLPLVQEPNAEIAPPKPALPSINAWLEQALKEKLHLPSALDPLVVLPLLEQRASLSPSALTQAWRAQTALTARLIDLGNSSSLKRSGKPIARLDDAISALGIDMALSTAMALTLDTQGTLQNVHLIHEMQRYQTLAEQVANIARAMALSAGVDELSCYTAGLLSRSGELALLRTLQDFIHRQGPLTVEQIAALIPQWSPSFGNQLKKQWRLPLPLRELIGAIHLYPSHATQRTLFVMHLAGLKATGNLQGIEMERLLRQAKLEPKQWLDNRDQQEEGKNHE